MAVWELAQPFGNAHTTAVDILAMKSASEEHLGLSRQTQFSHLSGKAGDRKEVAKVGDPCGLKLLWKPCEEMS